MTAAELAGALGRHRPELLAAAVGLLPLDLLLAVRVGLEAGHLRVGASLEEDYAGGRWHRQHVLLLRDAELRRFRYPPTGDRQLWVEYGPAGPPARLARREVA